MNKSSDCSVSDQAPAPNPDNIPRNDVVGVTVVLLQVFYLNREFVRVGYYVNNDYVDEQLKDQMETQLSEHPRVPLNIQFDKLQRSILADKPRVWYYSSIEKISILPDTLFPVLLGNKIFNQMVSWPMSTCALNRLTHDICRDEEETPSDFKNTAPQSEAVAMIEG